MTPPEFPRLVRLGSGSRVEDESGNPGVEGRPIFSLEIVLPFHVPIGRLENAEALILMNPAGRYHRLLSNDTIALNLGVLADGVMDSPAALEELSPHGPDVFNADKVGEDEPVGLGIGLIGKKQGVDGDPDPVSFAIEKR